MVDRAGLENRCARKGTVGSNPTLSAKIVHWGYLSQEIAPTQALPITVPASLSLRYYGSNRCGDAIRGLKRALPPAVAAGQHFTAASNASFEPLRRMLISPSRIHPDHR